MGASAEAGRGAAEVRAWTFRMRSLSHPLHQGCSPVRWRGYRLYSDAGSSRWQSLHPFSATGSCRGRDALLCLWYSLKQVRHHFIPRGKKAAGSASPHRLHLRSLASTPGSACALALLEQGGERCHAGGTLHASHHKARGFGLHIRITSDAENAGRYAPSQPGRHQQYAHTESSQGFKSACVTRARQSNWRRKVLIGTS